MTDQERKDLEELKEATQKLLTQTEEKLVLDLSMDEEEYQYLIKKARYYKGQIDRINQLIH